MDKSLRYQLAQKALKSALVEFTGNAGVKRNLVKIACAMDNKEVVYLSGKVTGLPEDQVKTKFKAAQDRFVEAGHSVINPVELMPHDVEWDEAMAACITLLPFATKIHLLHDWQDSKGATIEKELAEKIGIGQINL